MSMDPAANLTPWLAAGAVVLGTLLALWVVIRPRHAVNARRRLGVEGKVSSLSSASAAATRAVGFVVTRTNRGLSWERALDRAGIKMSLPEYIILVGAAALAGVAVGALLGNVLVGAMLVFFAVAGSVVLVVFRSEARRRAFTDQLEDVLMLLASNLRSGHSLQQSLDSLTLDVEEPAARELSRAVTQVRVGRDFTEALHEVADRMDSDDFRWIVQAIAIHRQVGGNLADVLDIVADTIRERGQIRRQVQALSAEGKLSGYVLIALPFFVILALSFLNPTYLAAFTQSGIIGYLMIAAASVLMIVGILWMRVMVRVEF